MAFVKTHLSCPYLRHTVTVNLPEVESKFLEECPLLWSLMLKSKAEMENINNLVVQSYEAQWNFQIISF